MLVTELRQRLEELERDGHGGRSVEVSPAPPPSVNWPNLSPQEERRYRPNFVVMNYVVTSATLSPLMDDPPVTLTFTEAGEPPDDPDLEEAETFAFR